MRGARVHKHLTAAFHAAAGHLDTPHTSPGHAPPIAVAEQSHPLTIHLQPFILMHSIKTGHGRSIAAHHLVDIKNLHKALRPAA